MLKKSFYIIGFISWLALVACSSGTVDPNANPMAGISEEQNSSSNSSSSSVWINFPPESSLSSSSVTQHVSGNAHATYIVVVKEELTVSVNIDFASNATKEYVIDATTKGYDKKTEGKIEVYEVEKGAAVSCSVDEKSYSAKFKFGLDNRIERIVKVEKFGQGCEAIFEQFKDLCLLQNVNDQLSGACDDDGSLEAYCAYTDEQADYDAYLSNFTVESKTNCGDDGVHIDSF
ncbi:hypothetical protein [Fibrobacter sp. UWB11]|uniref:hypothetical protein n=1 Tax=Fibrobacter sp. UWB11 TaxID=1896202 RepID=UPI000927B496|nr:hypothetical protein [Fibrobacter sp. UWB11]SIO27951.1 hypothetical protein SAMN05720758_1940 [Fibrobacter sp. UWB11]